MKFKVIKDEYNYRQYYWLYVKKVFLWVAIEHFAADNIDEAIEKAKEMAYNYKNPTLEFEL